MGLNGNPQELSKHPCILVKIESMLPDLCESSYVTTLDCLHFFLLLSLALALAFFLELISMKKDFLSCSLNNFRSITVYPMKGEQRLH